MSNVIVKPNVLLLLHGSYSHIVSFGKAIEILLDISELMICTQSFANLIVKEFKCKKFFIDVMPFGLGFEQSIALEKYDGDYKYDLNLRIKDTLYLYRKVGLNKLFSNFMPNLIFIDILYASDVLLIREILGTRTPKLYYLSVMASQNRSKGNPPICYTWKPNSIINANILWHKYNLQKEIKSALQKIKYFSYSDKRILLKHVHFPNKINDIQFRDYVGSSKIKGIEELIFIPKEFELAAVDLIHSKYIGFQFMPPKSSQNYEDVYALIKKLKSQRSKIIYCSFGTLYGIYKKKIKTLIKKLFILAKRNKEFYFIISLKKNLFDQYKLDIPKNVSIFNFLPQYEVLKNANLFISHGGINSIKEGIYSNTPMLIYPINMNWDQPGNGLRVQQLGIGINGNLRKDSYKEIEKKIFKLLNSNGYAQNIKDFIYKTSNYNTESLRLLINRILYMRRDK